MVKLFVGGFPLEIIELELAKLIVPFGDIATIKIVRDSQTRKCKGYAFIEMVTPEGADAAIHNLHGAEMGGRELTVKISEIIPAPQKYGNRKPFTTAKLTFHQGYQAARSDRPKRPRRSLS